MPTTARHFNPSTIFERKVTCSIRGPIWVRSSFARKCQTRVTDILAYKESIIIKNTTSVCVCVVFVCRLCVSFVCVVCVCRLCVSFVCVCVCHLCVCVVCVCVCLCVFMNIYISCFPYVRLTVSLLLHLFSSIRR